MPTLNLARAAEALLRTLGGGEVTLRCAGAPAADAVARELGLAAPSTEDLTVSPVLVRSTGGTGALGRDEQVFELLFAPSSLAACVAKRQQSPEDFLSTVLAIVYPGHTLRVRCVATDTFAGATYLYRVTAAE